MNTSLQKRNMCRLFVIMSVLLFFSMLLFEKSISPLYRYSYGVDSAHFRLIGSEIRNGAKLYTDIWDHKGPILFFIQFIGALWSEKSAHISAIYIVQYINICVTLYTYIKLYELNEQGFLRYLVLSLLATYLGHFYLIEGGNLTEDTCAPIITLCLYLFFQYVKNSKSSPLHPWRYSLVYGICFGVVAFIRISNAISIITGVLWIIVNLAVRREWKNLLINILAGILGIVIVATPIIIYFAGKESLHEMIYATFIFNVKYVEGGRSSVRKINLAQMRFLPIYVSIMLVTMKIIKERRISHNISLLCSIIAANILLLSVSNKYNHYFVVFIPVFFCSLILSCDTKNIWNYLCIILVCIMFSYCNIKSVPRLTDIVKPYKPYESAKYIPKSERNSVVGYDISPSFFLVSGIRPKGKYPCNQTSYFKIDPQLGKEYYEWVLDEKPLWILTLHSHQSKEIEEILDKYYTYMFSDELVYYRLSEAVEN